MASSLPAATELFARFLDSVDRDGDLDALCAAHPAHAERFRVWWSRLRAFDAVSRGGDEDATAMASWVRGARIGGYELIEQIGRGGQGSVWRARDLGLDRIVAIKVLAATACWSPRQRQRLVREARATACVQHPGICEVYGVAEHDGVPFLVMRFLAGRTLAARLEDERARGETSAAGARARVAAALRLGIDMALAIHAAHVRGLVHRDLKPANVMITETGQPVILDFGLATATDASAPSLTRTGDLLGTPAWMSPEQLRGDHSLIDARTDVWSLGVMLYELVTLRRPFTAGTREALHEAILTEEPPSPRRNGVVSRDLATVILTALAKDRDRRYRSAHDLATELQRVLDREPIQARPAGLPTRLLRWCQRRPAIASTLAVTGVALAAMSAWFGAHLIHETDRARAGAEAARSALARSEGLRDEILELADHRILADLRRRARDELWPAHPGMVPDLLAWLDRAHELVGRLPHHFDRLPDAEALAGRSMARELAAAAATLRLAHGRLRALPATLRVDDPAAVAVRAEIQRHRTSIRRLQRQLAGFLPDVDATDDGSGWYRRMLTGLVRELIDCVDGTTTEHDTLLAVHERVLAADDVGFRSHERIDASMAWRDARSRIRANRSYSGLDLAPQIGLLPLGPDPASGFEEFAHVASGTAPARTAAGTLDLRPESALVLILLPGGTFAMGTERPAKRLRHSQTDPRGQPAERPVHEVTLSPFFIGKHEMTRAQWRRLRGEEVEPTKAMLPIGLTSWQACQHTARIAGLLLPTEAQWEYAARGGTITAFVTGTTPASAQGRGNLADPGDGFDDEAPIGSFPPNPFGLFDISGNQREPCRDAFLAYFAPVRAGDGLRGSDPPRDFAVMRDSGFESRAYSARIARRERLAVGAVYSWLGLRPVAEVKR